MPTRLRLSCRALLIVVLVRRNFYSALCLAIVHSTQFRSTCTLTEFSPSTGCSWAQASHQLNPALGQVRVQGEGHMAIRVFGYGYGLGCGLC